MGEGRTRTAVVTQVAQVAQEKHVFSLCVKRDVCFYIHLLYFTCSSCDTKKKRVKKLVKSRVSGVTGRSILLVPYLCLPVPLSRKNSIRQRNVASLRPERRHRPWQRRNLCWQKSCEPWRKRSWQSQRKYAGTRSDAREKGDVSVFERKERCLRK